MISYSKSTQIGKKARTRKKKRDGSNLSRVDQWDRARVKVKVKFYNLGITNCEFVDVNDKACKTGHALGFAHEQKRRDLEPGDLTNINKILLMCNKHHHVIEYNEDEKNRLFSKLRPINE